MLARADGHLLPVLTPGKQTGAKGREQPRADDRGLAAARSAHDAEETDLHGTSGQLSDQPLPAEEVGGVVPFEGGEAFVGAGLDGEDVSALDAVQAAELQPDHVVGELEIGRVTVAARGQELGAAARRRLASERAHSLTTS